MQSPAYSTYASTAILDRAAAQQPAWLPVALGVACGALFGVAAATVVGPHTSALYVSVQPTTAAAATRVAPLAAQKEMKHMVDFGARDATGAEVASNFGNEVIGGHPDTSHNVRIGGEKTLFGILAKKCQPLEEGAVAFDEAEANTWRQMAGAGVRLETDSEGRFSAAVTWNADGAEKAEAIVQRLKEVEAQEAWAATITVDGDNKVVATGFSDSLGGVVANDFILLAKMNDLDMTDLVKKRKRRTFA